MQGNGGRRARKERRARTRRVPKARLVLVADEISPVIISLSSRGKCIPRTRVASALLNHKRRLINIPVSPFCELHISQEGVVSERKILYWCAHHAFPIYILKFLTEKSRPLLLMIVLPRFYSSICRYFRPFTWCFPYINFPFANCQIENSRRMH